MRLLPTLVLAALLAGCYDSSFEEPDNDPPAQAATTTIGALRLLYAGTTFRIDTDVVVTGRVTSSDRAGNFYRSICIESDQAALEVMAGIDQLYNDFPIGTSVTIRLKGLAVGESRSVLQAGRMPAPGSGYTTDYLGSRAAVGAVLLRNGEAVQPPIPKSLTIEKLTPAQCGTLVRISGLRYTPEELTQSSWAGYKRFTDSHNAAIYTYVRTYASFAAEDVPTGEVSLTGILQYDATGDGRYLLKIRDESDCLH